MELFGNEIMGLEILACSIAGPSSLIRAFWLGKLRRTVFALSITRLITYYVRFLEENGEARRSSTGAKTGAERGN